jgi:hypothetical protein
VSDSQKTARNVAIIVVLAAAVYLLPGGGRAAVGFEALLLAGFAIGMGYVGLRTYREYHVAIYGLGDRYRPLLYGALGVGTVTIVAKGRMWQTGLGELAWFLLMGIVVYALIATYRYWRSY